MGYIAKDTDYWIHSSALTFTLNALNVANYIQCTVAGGAVIQCFIPDADEVGTLGYSASHGYKSWKLQAGPTAFNNDAAKYVYAAIPKDKDANTAMVVYPSEKLDINGQNEAGQQIGNTNYYYIWLQGVISAVQGTRRSWNPEISTGKLDTAAGDAERSQSSIWYEYSAVADAVTLIKRLSMAATSWFTNIRLGSDKHSLTGVATAVTADEFMDSDELVATPSYIKANYVSKKNDDTVEGNITFQKDISVSGNALVNGILTVGNWLKAKWAELAYIKSPDYTGDGAGDTGFLLTNDYNGHSRLTVDELYVRMKAIFEELQVKKETVVGGNQIFSCTSNIISFTRFIHVEERGGEITETDVSFHRVKMPVKIKGLPAFISRLLQNTKIVSNILSKSEWRRKTYTDETEFNAAVQRVRCYFLAKEGENEIENWWVGDSANGHDLAKCQTFNLTNKYRESYVTFGGNQSPNVYWWRKVVGVSSSPVEIEGKMYHWFDVAVSDCAQSSDIPAAGDHVSQFGNDTDPERMNLISIEINDSEAPAIKMYEGIDSYSLTMGRYGNPLKTRFSPKAGYKMNGSKFELVTEYASEPIPIERGDWVQGTYYYYYNIVQHNGASWLCIASSGNPYIVKETFTHQYSGGGSITYPAGKELSQQEYNTLTPEEKAKCYQSERGATLLEPSEENSAVWKIYAQKGEKGDAGENIIRLDLDNEYEEFLYDDAGVRKSAIATSQARLYDGHTQKTTGVTWAVSCDNGEHWVNQGNTYTSGNAKAKINSDGLLTIEEVYASSVKIMVRATYGTLPYYADFTANKVKQDKYTLSLSPSAISYNPADAPVGGVNITPSATRIDLQGNTSNVTIATAAAEGNVCVYFGFVNADGTKTEMSLLTTASYNVNGSTWEYEGMYFELRKLNNSSGTNYRLCDYDTVPFAKVRNGEKGDGVSYDAEHSSVGYAYSSMGTPEAGRDYPSDITSWSANPPAIQKGKYLWTKDDTAYNNAGTIVHTITYGVQYQPNDGESVEIDSSRTFVKYCKQSRSQFTGTPPADSAFSTTFPSSLGQGDYLWILNQVAYVGVTNPLKSYSVSMLGTDGSQGDPGPDGYTTHFAYATSADGSQNFSTSNFSGATYIGTYRDQQADDSQDYRDYTWTKWKGDKGNKGDDAQYIYLKGTARDANSQISNTVSCEVKVNGGTNFVAAQSRGLNLVTINRQTLARVESINYDTYGEAAGESGARGITDLISELGRLSDNVFVCLVSFDAIGWSNDLITALQGYGMGDLPYTATGRYPFLFIGYKNLGKGNGLTRMRNIGNYYDVVELSAYIANGALTVKDGIDGKDGQNGAPGAPGENSVRLDLDNEHEDYIYNDSSAAPVAPDGGATSQAHLYDGSAEVPASNVNWTISSSTGTPTSGSYAPSINASGLLRVPRLNADTAKVTVRAEYPTGSGKYYYADFTANKVRQDKYDLTLSPSAISYNPADEPQNGVNITPSATRTDLQGNTSGVTIDTSEGTGNLCVYFGLVNSDGTVGAMGLLSTASLNISGSTWGKEGVYFELRKLTSSDGSTYRLCDHGTVPFAKVTNGTDNVRIDLDNDYDAIQYQGDGTTKVNANASVSTKVYLYEGTTDVSDSADASYSILARENMSASQAAISGRIVTVDGLTADGSVTIRAIYKGKYYDTKFIVKKLVGTDKFELVVTPTGVTVNTSDTTQADKTISVQVYRTPAGGGTRALVTWTNRTGNDYGLSLGVRDSLNNALTETTPTTAQTTRTFNLTGTMAVNADNVTVRLLRSLVVVDAETVVVTHVHNGIDGTGANAVRIDLDNGMDSIPCDSSGNVLESTALTTNARIYDGATPVTSGVSIVNIGTLAGVTASSSINNGVVTITWTIPSGSEPISAEKYTAQIELLLNNNHYYATFVASVVKSGEPGMSPTIQQLAPTPTQVMFKRGSDGTLSPSSTNVSLMIKETGDGGTTMVTPASSGLTVRFSYTSMPSAYNEGWPWPSSGLTIQSYTTNGNIYLAAFDEDHNLVDSEVIPIIKDGAKGDDAVTYQIEFKDTTFAYNPNTGKNLISIKGVVYKSDGTNVSQMGNITSAMFNMRFVKANGNVVRELVADTDFGVESGVFVTTNGNGQTNAEEQSFIVEFKPDGTNVVAQAAIAITNYGQNGAEGEQGPVGRFYYWAQEWQDSDNVSYRVSDVQAPFFSYGESYYMFNPIETGTYTMRSMGTPGSNDNWELMTSVFKYLITEAIFGNFAHFGSFIINGNWLFSQYGMWGSDNNPMDEENGHTISYYEVAGGQAAERVENVEAYTTINMEHPERTYKLIIDDEDTKVGTEIVYDPRVSYYGQFVWEDYLVYSIRCKCDADCRLYLRKVGESSNTDYALPMVRTYESRGAYIWSLYIKVRESGNYRIVAKHSNPSAEDPRVQVDWMQIYERSFRPNYAVDGKTGKTVQWKLYGNLTGEVSATHIVNSGNTNLNGQTYIEHLQINAGGDLKMPSWIDGVQILNSSGYAEKQGYLKLQEIPGKTGEYYFKFVQQYP